MESATGSWSDDDVLADRVCRWIRLHAIISDGNTEFGRALILYSLYASKRFDSGHDPLLPANAICFPLECFPAYSIYDAFIGADGSHNLIVDFYETDKRTIPMAPILPFPKSPVRQARTLADTDMLPVFFVNIDRTVGFALLGPYNSVEERTFGRESRTSLKVRFSVRHINLFMHGNISNLGTSSGQTIPATRGKCSSGLGRIGLSSDPFSSPFADLRLYLQGPCGTLWRLVNFIIPHNGSLQASRTLKTGGAIQTGGWAYQRTTSTIRNGGSVPVLGKSLRAMWSFSALSLHPPVLLFRSSRSGTDSVGVI
jgi:hypothetical protein